MNYLSNKKGFLGLDNKSNFKEKVVIVPFGLEKTVSYGGGTKNGPKEIIKASHQVELYDEEFNCEPYKKIGIKTLKPFKIDKNINKALDKMSSINNEILNKKLFPMTFGGEHSITPGCLKPFVKKHKKICLLHFDAHADLRDSYEGEKFSHASANSPARGRPPPSRSPCTIARKHRPDDRPTSAAGRRCRAELPVVRQRRRAARQAPPGMRRRVATDPCSGKSSPSL